MPFTIQLAQVEPTLGNLEKNLELHLEHLDAALGAGVDLLLFPELSLTGYFLKDQTSDAALRIDGAPEILRERSKSISIGVGFVERASDGRLYNSYAILEDGKLLHVHRKVHLVTYGMFEESRDVAAGEHFVVAESKHGRIGVLLCEDLWHMMSSWLYFLEGVDLLLVPSAGPARGVSADGEPGLTSLNIWKTLLTAQAMLFQTWSVYVNRSGCEDGITFGGGSRIVDPFGREAACLEGLSPGTLTHEIDLRANERARLQTPLRRDEKPWLVLRELRRQEEAEQ